MVEPGRAGAGSPATAAVMLAARWSATAVRSVVTAQVGAGEPDAVQPEVGEVPEPIVVG